MGRKKRSCFPLWRDGECRCKVVQWGILVREHQRGRATVTELSEAADAYSKGDLTAKGPLLKSLQGITELYPNHIWKEDYLLFPMAGKVLALEDQLALLEKFEMVEESIGTDVHRRFEQLAEKLEASYF